MQIACLVVGQQCANSISVGYVLTNVEPTNIATRGMVMKWAIVDSMLFRTPL